MKIGDIVLGYTITSFLGEGGMAQVYEVEKDGIKYALKVCKPKSEDDIPRFKREYRMLSAIHNENVIRVFTEGEEDGIPFYVMEKGHASLADTVSKALTNEEQFKYVFQVCKGVEAIHSYGIIHRDLNPNNVIFCSGIMKVSDFGLGRFVSRDTASLTLTDSLMGTYGYAAPELGDGIGAFKQGSPLLDVYALGGIIYYVFSSGARPDMINPRNVEADILSVVNKCREQNPDDRFQTVESVRGALEAIERSRHSYSSVSDVLCETSLTEEAKANLSLGIFVKSDTIREVLDTYQTIRQKCWAALKNARSDYAEVIAHTVLKVFEKDKETWVQFNDVDTIAEITVTLFSSNLNDSVKVSLFKEALKYAVNFNRWTAMRTLNSYIISKWDTETVKPYAELILSDKDLFITLEDAIEVKMPLVISKYWE